MFVCHVFFNIAYLSEADGTGHDKSRLQINKQMETVRRGGTERSTLQRLHLAWIVTFKIIPLGFGVEVCNNNFVSIE